MKSRLYNLQKKNYAGTFVKIIIKDEWKSYQLNSSRIRYI